MTTRRVPNQTMRACLSHRFVHVRRARRARLSQAAAVLAHRSSTDTVLRACRCNNIAGTRPTTSTSTCARSATFAACKNACKARDGPRQRDDATALRMRARMQSNRTHADSRCAKSSRSSTPTRTSSCSRQNACICCTSWTSSMRRYLDSELDRAPRITGLNQTLCPRTALKPQNVSHVCPLTYISMYVLRRQANQRFTRTPEL